MEDEGLYVDAKDIASDTSIKLFPLSKSEHASVLESMRQNQYTSWDNVVYMGRKRMLKEMKTTVHYHYHDKVVEIATCLETLKTKSPGLYSSIIGTTGGSSDKAAAASEDNYDEDEFHFMETAALFLTDFINANACTAPISSRLALCIPPLSSMTDELDLVSANFDGPAGFTEGSSHLHSYIMRLLQMAITTKASYKVIFEATLNRKVLFSQDCRLLTAPFTWTSRNLQDCGLTHEVQLHGIVKCERGGDKALRAVKISFDPLCFSHAFGKAEFSPI